jgi:hypothetical protein
MYSQTQLRGKILDELELFSICEYVHLLEIFEVKNIYSGNK